MVEPSQPGEPGGRRPLTRQGNLPPRRTFETRAKSAGEGPARATTGPSTLRNQAPQRKGPVPLGPAVAPLDAAYKMVGPVLMGMVLGYFLDNYLHTRPWWFLGMTVFGLVTGFWSLLKPLYFKPEASENGEAAPPDTAATAGIPPAASDTSTAPATPGRPAASDWDQDDWDQGAWDKNDLWDASPESESPPENRPGRP